MKKLEQQNKDPEVTRMRELLKGVPRPTRSEREWTLMQNEVFARLDELQQEKARPRPIAPRKRIWIPSAAVSVAALVIAFIFSGSLSVFKQPSPIASRVLSVAGTISYETDGSRGSISPGNLRDNPVFAGAVFETGESGSLTLQLDSATAVRLSSGTRLQVVAANSRNLDFRLDRGHILATVAERKPGMHFGISTAHADCRVVGTVFSVSVDSPATDANETLLRVYEGKVSMLSRLSGESQMVSAGNELAMRKTNTGEVTKSSSGRELRDLSLLSLAMNADSDSQPTGILEVRSNPTGATVTSDGEILGTTPLLTTRNEGVHGITLAMKGYDSETRQIEVDAREHLALDVSLAESVTRRPRRHTVPNRSYETQTQPKESELSQEEDMPEDFVDDPSFVEAMIQMTIGEYGKALALLRDLHKSPKLSLEDRATIAGKISQCYRGIGDFDRAYRRLEREYHRAATPQARSQMLWEMANLKANCLADYPGAINLLTRYVEKHPKGAWAGEAEQKLEELRFLVDRTGLSKVE